MAIITIVLAVALTHAILVIRKQERDIRNILGEVK